MKNRFFVAATCCLVAMGLTFISCGDKNDDSSPSTPQSATAIKAEVSYAVDLSGYGVTTSLNDVSLIIHYRDAAGQEQTKAITADGERVAVMFNAFPAEFKFYITGTIKDNTKATYDFGLTLRRTVRLYMSDGSSQVVAQRSTSIGGGGQQKDYFIDDYLPNSVPTLTTYSGKVMADGEIQ